MAVEQGHAHAATDVPVFTVQIVGLGHLEAHAPRGKKKRDADAFNKARQDIEELRRRAQAGEIELAYLDEAGFAQVHPNRSAWTQVGEQHCIDAPRGERLNVMAAWLSSGEIVPAHYWKTTNALVFLGFLMQLLARVSKPLVVILDNASIHKAQAIQWALKVLQEKKGLTLYFLPPTALSSTALRCCGTP